MSHLFIFLLRISTVQQVYMGGNKCGSTEKTWRALHQSSVKLIQSRFVFVHVPASSATSDKGEEVLLLGRVHLLHRQSWGTVKEPSQEATVIWNTSDYHPFSAVEINFTITLAKASDNHWWIIGVICVNKTREEKAREKVSRRDVKRLLKRARDLIVASKRSHLTFLFLSLHTFHSDPFISRVHDGSSGESSLVAQLLIWRTLNPGLNQIQRVHDWIWIFNLHLIFFFTQPEKHQSLFSACRLLSAVSQVKSRGGSVPVPLNNCRRSAEYTEQRPTVPL